MKVSTAKLLQLLVDYFTYDEIRNLSLRLGIDFDTIRGETKPRKAREVIAYADRQGLLDEFVQLVLHYKSELSDEFVSQTVLELPHQKADADILMIELANMRQQLDELKQKTVGGRQLEEQLEGILKIANSAIGRGEELTARLILPRQEDTDVPLVPVHLLDRLEEYRSDENIAFLLIGTFGGAIFGVLVNWATSDVFVVTRISVVLTLMLLGLISAACFWAWRLRLRAASIKKKMLNPQTPYTNPE